MRRVAFAGDDGALDDAVALLVDGRAGSGLGIDYARLELCASDADPGLPVGRGPDAAHPPVLAGDAALWPPAEPTGDDARPPDEIELWPGRSGALPAALRAGGLASGARIPLRGGTLTVGSRRTGSMSELALACCQAAAASLEEALARRRLDAKLLRLQRMQVAGELAATVVHDFNNVLAAVMGVTALVRDRLPAADRAHEYLDMIDSLSTSAAALSRQLLDFTRGCDDCVQPTDLNDLVRETCALARSITASNVEVCLDLREPLPRVLAERPPLQQSLLNLVLNAAEAMPRGGRVLLRTRLVPGAASDRSPRDDGSGSHTVAIDVADGGSGIPPGVLPRIFDPFFTTKHASDGTGLGLTSVQQIVRRHGGRVEAESTVGVGSTFTVRLPASFA